MKEKYTLEVDVVNLKDNPSPDLSQYGDVIIGSGVRVQKVYREALKFIEKNDFRNRKIAIFLSSAEAGNPKSYNDAIEYVEGQVLDKNPSVKAIAAEAFGGRMKILGRVVSGEHDINKVREWSGELGKRLTG